MSKRPYRSRRDQDAVRQMAERMAMTRMLFSILAAGGAVLGEQFDFDDEQRKAWGRATVERLQKQFAEFTADVRSNEAAKAAGKGISA